MATPIPDNVAAFTLAEVAQATGGALHGADRRVEGVCTDSRKAGAGALFVALRGARHDAHSFLPAVAEAGAAALVAEDADVPEGMDAVRVADTTVALGALARAHRRRWAATTQGRLVAITGSAGKTSTKEMAAAAFRHAGFSVAATRGNLNNQVGVPMTLLTLSDEDLAVVEIGTSARGEIAALAAIAEPDVGVVTLVAAAHTEGIGDLEDVRREKLSLLDAVPEGARIAESTVGGGDVVYGDRGRVRLLGWAFDEREGVPVTVARHAVHSDEDEAREIQVTLRLLGEAAARNSGAVLAIADVLGVDLDAVAAGIGTRAPVAGRMCPYTGRGGALVLDDSYNASPHAVELALESARRVADDRDARLHVVLGDMKELGDESDEAHERVRDRAERLADRAFFVGPLMARGGEAIMTTDVEAIVASLGTLGADDVVLIKGSRSMGLERLVTALLPKGQRSGLDHDAASSAPKGAAS